MRAVRTQFDTGEFQGTVATPTCCSCCCCCCCVTTAATASIVGAGAAVVAGRRRSMSVVRKVVAVVLGVIAPWVFLLPTLVAFVIPLSGSLGFIPLLAAGLLLLVVCYLVFPRVLGHRHPVRVGVAGALSVLGLGFVEAFVMFHALARYATGDLPNGWAVLYGYVTLAVVAAVVVGLLLLIQRDPDGRTMSERWAGVPPRQANDDPTAGEAV